MLGLSICAFARAVRTFAAAATAHLLRQPAAVAAAAAGSLHINLKQVVRAASGIHRPTYSTIRHYFSFVCMRVSMRVCVCACVFAHIKWAHGQPQITCAHMLRAGRGCLVRMPADRPDARHADDAASSDRSRPPPPPPMCIAFTDFWCGRQNFPDTTEPGHTHTHTRNTSFW